MHTHPHSSSTPTGASRPFLRWTGGKARLLSQLLPLLPPGRRLIEPFLGAGSVFLAANYDEYLLGDANPDLIAAWVALKQRPKEFCAAAARYFDPQYHSRDAYLRLRAAFNASADSFERAALMPYLNRFGFNGLFRVNQRGQFNVPYGDPLTLPAFPWEQLNAAAVKLERATLLSGGFTATIAEAGAGDVVYADPPYLARNMAQAARTSFTAYTEGGFGLAEHLQLLECCKQAAWRGATVLISNHDTLQTRQLYEGLRLEALLVRRSVSASSEARAVVSELVAIF